MRAFAALGQTPRGDGARAEPVSERAGSWTATEASAKSLAMRRRGPGLLLLAWLLAVVFSAGREATAADATEEGSLGAWKDRIKLAFSTRVRGEFVDFFRPPSASPGAENRYDFLGTQTRFGTEIQLPHARLVLAVQETLLANVPTDAIAPSPIGALGTGAVYFQNTSKSFQQEPFLKLGFLELRHRGLTAQLGRFEIRDGLETIPTNPSLLFLKRERISERLVGPFDFTHVTRSFDGGLFVWDRPAWNVTAYGTKPTQGGFEISANPEIDDIVLAGASVTAKRLPEQPFPFDGRVFYLYYDDARENVVKVDNRPLPERQADTKAIRLHTIGAHAIALGRAGPGEADLLLWGLVQTGRWGELDQTSWAFAVEAGYQMASLPTSPWLRVGFDRSSGDPDPSDGTHETFFQILPTARRYARFPFFNLMNDQDLFAQILLAPHPLVLIQAEYHWLSLTESGDLWYSGGGATNGTLFGYSGIPSGGHRELAHLIDLSASWRILPELSVNAYISHAFGQSVVGSTFAGHGATYGFIETFVSF